MYPNRLATNVQAMRDPDSLRTGRFQKSAWEGKEVEVYWIVSGWLPCRWDLARAIMGSLKQLGAHLDCHIFDHHLHCSYLPGAALPGVQVREPRRGMAVCSSLESGDTSPVMKLLPSACLQ